MYFYTLTTLSVLLYTHHTTRTSTHSPHYLFASLHVLLPTHLITYVTSLTVLQHTYLTTCVTIHTYLTTCVTTHSPNYLRYYTLTPLHVLLYTLTPLHVLLLHTHPTTRVTTHSPHYLCYYTHTPHYLCYYTHSPHYLCCYTHSPHYLCYYTLTALKSCRLSERAMGVSRSFSSLDFISIRRSLKLTSVDSFTPSPSFVSTSVRVQENT